MSTLRLQGKTVARIHFPGSLDERLSKIGVDTPVSKAGFDISQALAIGELSRGHVKILIEASEFFDPEIALVSFHAFVKDVEEQMLHYLREDIFPAEHIPVLHVVLRADASVTELF